MHGVGLDSIRLEEYLRRNFGVALFWLLLCSHLVVEGKDDSNNGVPKEVCDDDYDEESEVVPFVYHILGPVSLGSFLVVV